MFVSLLKRKGLKLRSAYSYMPAKQKSFPSFSKSLICLQLRACEANKLPSPLTIPLTRTTLEVACFSASHCMRFILKSLSLILKFHERVISALILVASFERPKISSQFLRVNGFLKFAK